MMLDQASQQLEEQRARQRDFWRLMRQHTGRLDIGQYPYTEHHQNVSYKY